MEMVPELIKASKEYNTEATLMSDSIVVSTPVGTIEAFRYFLFVVARIYMMIPKFVLRGAITCGEIYHRSNMVFGPAMINAYRTEEKDAVYPRIIIKNNDIKDILKEEVSWKEIFSQYFLLDIDNEIYFDTFQYLLEQGVVQAMNTLKDPNKNFAAADNGLTVLIIGYEMLRFTFANNFWGNYEVEGDRILKKYEWLAKQLIICNDKLIDENLGSIIPFPFSPFHKKLSEGIEIDKTFPIILRKILVLNPRNEILTVNDKLPTVDFSKQSTRDFIGVVEKDLINGWDNSNGSFIQPPDLWGWISVESRASYSRKMDILEVNQYIVLWSKDCELIPASLYSWQRDIALLGDEKKKCAILLEHLGVR
jgi:hypothetical protein